MANFKLDAKMMGLLTFIGSVIVIVAAFLTWITYEGVLTGTTNYGGMNLGDYTDGWQANIPLISLILAVIMIVVEIVDYMKPEMLAKYVSIIVFVLSLVILALGILFITWDIFGTLATAGITVAEVKVGMGCYVAIIGAAISLILSVGQAFEAFKKLANKN